MMLAQFLDLSIASIIRHVHPLNCNGIASHIVLFHVEIFRYANEPNIMKYIKIAASLPDKTVRDVAMRCRWMTVSISYLIELIAFLIFSA